MNRHQPTGSPALQAGEDVTDANEGPSDEPVESDVPPAVDDPGEPSRWKKFAIGAGALIVTVGGTIVATLAATKKSAIGENAKAYATGSFPLGLDSSASVARLLVAMQYDRLPIDYLARRDALIRAVTIEDARRVARRLFAAPGFLTVIVGEPQGIADSGG